jgi:hypothetical protein
MLVSDGVGGGVFVIQADTVHRDPPTFFSR